MASRRPAMAYVEGLPSYLMILDIVLHSFLRYPHFRVEVSHHSLAIHVQKDPKSKPLYTVSLACYVVH